MLDLFHAIVQPLHWATLLVLNTFRVNIAYEFCPTWRPKMLEPSASPPLNIWCDGVPLCTGVIEWLSFFTQKTPAPMFAEPRNATATDAELCGWLAETPTYSFAFQAYAVVQLLLVCGTLYPLLLVVQAMVCAAWPSFSRLSFNSQRYVLLNLGKAGILACQSVSLLWLSTVNQALLNADSVLNVAEQKTLTLQVIQSMVFYVAIDFLALFTVPKLPVSSTLHHIATVALTIAIAPLDIFANDTARMVLVYGALSTVAYLVNAYLALYGMYKKQNEAMLGKRRLRILAGVALFIYAAECCFNWSVQFQWYLMKYVGSGTFTTETKMATAYMFVMITVFVRDDVILALALWRTVAGVKEGKPKENEAEVDGHEEDVNEKELQRVIEDVAAIKNKVE